MPYIEQSILHTPNYCLTNFLPDRCSTGSAIPGGGLPRVRGLPDYDSTTPPAGARLSGTPEMPILTQLSYHGRTRILLPQAGRIFPNSSICTFTHNHVFTKVSGLSPYCCSTCPGFRRTAVLRVRTLTVLLFYPFLNNTCLPMELADYPPNAITKHLYIGLNNTLYQLNICIHPSLSRPRQQLNSNRKLRVTSHIPVDIAQLKLVLCG